MSEELKRSEAFVEWMRAQNMRALSDDERTMLWSWCSEAWKAAWSRRQQVPEGLLIGRIHNLATKHSPDYPNVGSEDALSQLFALEGTLEGINAANADLHKIIEALRKKCGMTIEEVQALDLALATEAVSAPSQEEVK